jgi:hypothetical protein
MVGKSNSYSLEELTCQPNIVCIIFSKCGIYKFQVFNAHEHNTIRSTCAATGCEVEEAIQTG